MWAVSRSRTEISLPALVGGGYGAFWRFRGRYKVVKGSRASKKSKTTSLWYIVHLMQCAGSNLLVVRRTFNTLKDSCWADLQWAAARLGVAHLWTFTVSPLEATYKPTGQKILFRGLDDPLRLASVTVPVGVLCWCWCEEAYEIETEADFDLVDDVIRGEMPEGLYKQITLTFNPWSHTTWLKRRFFDHAPDPDILAITTNYLCNEWLDDADRRRFERMRDEQPDRYLVAGLGQWGVTGRTIFNAGDVSRRLDALAEPEVGLFVGREFRRDGAGNVYVYHRPEPGVPYVIGADTAGDGSDWFVAQVLDNRTGEQVAVLRQQMDEPSFAAALEALGYWYNTALVGVEVNFSTYVVLELERRGYPRQYVRQSVDAFTHKPVDKYGFVTTSNTRETIISNLVEAARDISIINDRATLEEMLTFVRNEKMRAEAEAGAHDDCIMSLAIAHFIRPQQRYLAEAAPEQTVEWHPSQWEDYERASPDERAYLLRKWGKPRR